MRAGLRSNRDTDECQMIAPLNLMKIKRVMDFNLSQDNNVRPEETSGPYFVSIFCLL